MTEASFDDPKVFSKRPTSELIFNYGVLRSCSIEPIVKLGTVVLNTLVHTSLSGTLTTVIAPPFVQTHGTICSSANSSLLLSSSGCLLTLSVSSHGLLAIGPALWVVERTYFKHFVAGADLDKSLKTAARLSHSGLNTILDYSIESADGNIDEVVDVLVESIRNSGQHRYTPFSCFKISALASHHLLMRVNEILEYEKSHHGFAPAKELFTLMESTNYPKTVESMIMAAKTRASSSSSSGVAEEKLPAPFSSEIPAALTVHELETLFMPLAKRLERLGESARECNQAILIDAEQSWFQETIHFAARCLMTRYNKEKPLVYNTYQMYLRTALDTLERDIAYSQANGLKMGAKIVRGAYMDAEAKWAQDRIGPDAPSPIHPTIEDTHTAYNTALSRLLDIANEGKGAVVIASHNERSMALASQGMATRHMPPDHPFVHLGQLYGMCDHMSLALADAGHNVVKYVPFGPVAEVIPYLLRRVSENRGFLASTKKEQRLMLSEIKSRLGIQSPPSGPASQLSAPHSAASPQQL